MATQYVGSVQYAAVAQFATAHAYNIGDIVRQLAAPAVGNERCFRCTTAGTSAGTEAAWTLTAGATTTQGTAVFTEVTGSATYNWAAPHARVANSLASGWATAGDNVYVSENHAETQSTAIVISGPAPGSAPINILCVNHAGSVPPVSADLSTTGSISTSASANLTFSGNLYLYGIKVNAGSSTGTPSITFGAAAAPTLVRLDSCAIAVVATGATSVINIGASATSPALAIWNNTTVKLSNVGQQISLKGPLIWKNTPSAVDTSIATPSALFGYSSALPFPGKTEVRGVDLSSIGSGKSLITPATAAGKILFANCKLGAGVSIFSVSIGYGGNSIELHNCDDSVSGKNYRMETYEHAGSVVQDSTVTRSGGYSDGVTPLSWKMASSSSAAFVEPLEAPDIYVWNDTTGSSKTISVEIINDGTTLTNADVWLEVEYLGTSAAPLSSRASSAAASILAAGSGIATSTATWNGTGGLTSPVKQTLSTSVTPQMKGFLRATVKVAKASQTLYVDPVIAVV